MVCNHVCEMSLLTTPPFGTDASGRETRISETPTSAQKKLMPTWWKK